MGIGDVFAKLKEQEKMVQENKTLILEQNNLFKQILEELREIKRILSEQKEKKDYG